MLRRSSSEAAATLSEISDGPAKCRPSAVFPWQPAQSFLNTGLSVKPLIARRSLRKRYRKCEQRRTQRNHELHLQEGPRQLNSTRYRRCCHLVKRLLHLTQPRRSITSPASHDNTGTSTLRRVSSTLPPLQTGTAAQTIPLAPPLPRCTSRSPLLLPPAMLATPSASNPRSARRRSPSRSAYPHARFRRMYCAIVLRPTIALCAVSSSHYIRVPHLA